MLDGINSKHNHSDFTKPLPFKLSLSSLRKSQVILRTQLKKKYFLNFSESRFTLIKLQPRKNLQETKSFRCEIYQVCYVH